MKNLKVWVKLIISFGIILLMTIFLVTFSTISLVIISNDMDTFYNEPFQNVQLLGQVGNNLQMSAKQIMQAAVDEDYSKTQELIDDSIELLKSVGDNLETVRSTYSGNIADLDDIETNIAQGMSVFEEFKKECLENDSDGAYQLYLNQISPCFSKAEEILENALNHYTGTIFYVSHDRYFINQTASRILELKNRKLINYLGNYDYYEEKKEELTAVYAPDPVTVKDDAPLSRGKQDYLERKAEAARIRKLKNDIAKVEEKIRHYEERLNELDALLEDPDIATNSVKLNEISKEQDEISTKLDSLMDEWEGLSEELA